MTRLVTREASGSREFAGRRDGDRRPLHDVAPAPTVRRVGRVVHPMAWWAWALGCAIAVSMVQNPLVNLLVLGAVWLVVLTRRTRAPWARSVGAYLTAALVVLGIRLFFQVVLGLNKQGTVLFTLPQLTLPDWAAGVRLGGPVTVDALLYTGYDALRLAGMLLCLGAANSLANPRRALRAVPPALYQVSVAVVVALSVAPQLIESVQRVRRARRLRGGASTGWHAVRAVLVPVLEDAVDRSLALAAGMEARGYGRTNHQRRVGWPTTLVLLLAMLAVVNGMFLGLGSTMRWPWLMFASGIALALLAFRLSGRRLAITRYRPDAWGRPEWALLLAGLGAVAVVLWLGRVCDAAMYPQTSPPEWPVLAPQMLVLVAVVASPLLTTPTPPKDAA